MRENHLGLRGPILDQPNVFGKEAEPCIFGSMAAHSSPIHCFFVLGRLYRTILLVPNFATPCLFGSMRPYHHVWKHVRFAAAIFLTHLSRSGSVMTQLKTAFLQYDLQLPSVCVTAPRNAFRIF